MLFRHLALPCLAAAVSVDARHAPVRARYNTVSPQLIETAKDLAPHAPSTDIVSQYLERISKYSASIDSLGNGTTSNANAACAIAKKLLPNGYVDASTGNYTGEEEVNWSSSCWLPAACYVTPESSYDVAMLLKAVTCTGSRFSVRSGGHNPNPGFASIDGSGMLIDLRGLNQRNLSSDNSVISAQAGNTWGDVYGDLDPLGLFAVGGRYLGVGISGLIQGGGIPIIPSLYGLAADNVENYEIVLGDSSIVNANANENSDLYQALKGGGNNFGIVTRFDLYTVPLHDLWYKGIVFNQSEYQSVLAAIVQTQNNMEQDNKAGIIIQAGFGVFQVTFIYAEHVGATPAVFQALDSMNGTAMIPATNGTALSFSTSESAPEPAGFRETAGLSSLVDLDLYTNVYEKYLTAQNYSTDPGTGLALVIQQFGKAAVDAGGVHGGNLFNLSPVAQNWWSILTEWTSLSDQQASHDALLGMTDYITQEAQQSGKLLPYVFPNTADASQDVMASYGSDSLAKLKAASQKYDPHQVFQQLQFGGWLVSKS